jgi:hypothetical protein
MQAAHHRPEPVLTRRAPRLHLPLYGPRLRRLRSHLPLDDVTRRRRRISFLFVRLALRAALAEPSEGLAQRFLQRLSPRHGVVVGVGYILGVQRGAGGNDVALGNIQQDKTVRRAGAQDTPFPVQRESGDAGGRGNLQQDLKLPAAVMRLLLLLFNRCGARCQRLVTLPGETLLFCHNIRLALLHRRRSRRHTAVSNGELSDDHLAGGTAHHEPAALAAEGQLLDGQPRVVAVGVEHADLAKRRPLLFLLLLRLTVGPLLLPVRVQIVRLEAGLETWKKLGFFFFNPAQWLFGFFGFFEGF